MIFAHFGDRQMQMQEKKRQKEGREIIQRLKPLAKLQTGQDFEDFVEGIICKYILFYSPSNRQRDFKGNRLFENESRSYSTIVVWA